MNTLLKHIFFLIFIHTSLSAQEKIGYGASFVYNFGVNTKGIGIRSQIPITNRILAIPQVKYFPSFNVIHEVYGGVNFHFMLISSQKTKGYNRVLVIPNKPNLYVTAGGGYNHWFNYITSINHKAKVNNLVPEVGLGSSVGSLTLRFFIEAKYNPLWNESFGEAGVLVYPGFYKIKNRNKCPNSF